MPLEPGCPHCSAPIDASAEAWSCAQHGPVPPLWRPREATHQAFGAHLAHAADFPTYVAWPLAEGWKVCDFALVGPPGRVMGSLIALAGPSSLDGDVEVLIVTEEPGAGLGARVAGTVHSDPGSYVATGAPLVQVRVGQHLVPLWPVPTQESDVLERSVVAGEAAGRWLWLVLRPATAVFMLAEPWQLAEVGEMGAQLVEPMFGGRRLEW